HPRAIRVLVEDPGHDPPVVAPDLCKLPSALTHVPASWLLGEPRDSHRTSAVSRGQRALALSQRPSTALPRQDPPRHRRRRCRAPRDGSTQGVVATGPPHGRPGGPSRRAACRRARFGQGRVLAVLASVAALYPPGLQPGGYAPLPAAPGGSARSLALRC